MSRFSRAAALAFALLAWGASRSSAQGKPGDLGLGFIAGSPLGFSAKYFLDPKIATDFALGVAHGDLDAHADLLAHLEGVVPSCSAGTFPLYVGLGFKVKDESSTFFGMRFVGGISWRAAAHPLEVFAEIAPVLRLAPGADSAIDGGVGLRYYFTLSRK